MLTPTDLGLIRDEVGATPADTTLEDWHDELSHWLPVAIRVLKRRLADASAGGQAVSSFSLDGVLSVGLGKADLRALAEQIARLEGQWAALNGQQDPAGVTVARIGRPDRYR